MKVLLANCGNPNLGEDKAQPRPGLPRPRWRTVGSLSEAARLCAEYVTKHALSPVCWAGGAVVDEDGEGLAQVSFNGRIWPVGGWREGARPIDPGTSVEQLRSARRPECAVL